MALSVHICLFILTLFGAFAAATRQRLISNRADGFAVENAGTREIMYTHLCAVHLVSRFL